MTRGNRGLLTLLASRRAAAVFVVLATLFLPAGKRSVAFAGSVAVDGSLLYRFYAYPDDNRRRSTVENFVDGDLRLRGELSPSLGYRVELHTSIDDAGFTTGVVDPRTEERRRPYFDFPEAVVDWTPRPEFRLSIGRQFVNWSGIDEIQPANLMTPLDESELFGRAPLGAYAVTTHLNLSKASVDLAVVPAMFQLTRLPQGRWRFEPDVVRQRIDKPPVEIDETQVGARIGTRLDTLEVALVGYYGRDMFPLFTLELEPAQIHATAVAHFPRTGAGGLTASWSIGESWLLRSEVVYYASSDSRRDEFFQYVPLGAEFTRGNWRVILNYLRVDRTKQGHDAVSQGEREFYPSFLFGEVSWDAGDRLRARLRGGYDFDKEFGLIQPEISYRVWRGLRVGLAAAVILADSTNSGYFDLIRHEDRLGVTLQYFL